MASNKQLNYFARDIKLKNSDENKLKKINSEILYSSLSRLDNNLGVCLNDLDFFSFDLQDETETNADKLKNLLNRQENLMQIYINTLFKEDTESFIFIPNPEDLCFKDDSRIKTDSDGNSYVTIEETDVYNNTNYSINSIISNCYNLNSLEANGLNREDIIDLIIKKNCLRNIDDIKVGQDIKLPSFDMPDYNQDLVETDENGNTISSSIDINGNLQQTVTGKNGRVISKSAFDDECDLKSTIYYEYDDEGNIISSKTILYDKNGNIISEELISN